MILAFVQVGEGDFFWESNGSSTFQEMAEDVETQIKQYQEVGCLNASQ